MRDFDPAFAAHLASGETTLCWCWTLTRSDQTVLGFTDHDRPVEVAGVTCDPGTGLSAGAIETASGFAVDNTDVSGVLDSEKIREQDLQAGLYDGAEVRVYRVNWADPAAHALMHVAKLGEIARGKLGFTAELRGLTDALNVERGRVFQYACDAELGDARCGVDLSDPAFSASATVTQDVTAKRFATSGLEAYQEGWFTGGLLTWTFGANAPALGRVKQHTVIDGSHWLELWEPAVSPIAASDTLDIVAGCDKTAPTCREKFANFINFRGFPHMPGNDFLFSYPAVGEDNDGSSLGHD